MPDINAVLLEGTLDIAHGNDSEGTCSLRDRRDADRNSRRYPGASQRRGNGNRSHRLQDAPGDFWPLPSRREDPSGGRRPDRKQAQTDPLPDCSAGTAAQTS